MKRIIRTLFCVLLCAGMLVSLAVVSGSAISADVDVSAWEGLELQALYIQSDAEIYSDLNEDYFEYWWEDEVPELENWFQACTINMRGFAMSPDGRYLYMGQLNGGTGVRGVVVYDTEKCVVTDLYYHYDGEAGLEGSPFSYAKGIAADERGYVYVGFAFSKNYNVVNLGIAKQLEDGTLEEISLKHAYEFGEPGDEGGIHVGVNGVDVAKVGDKYYCYVMVNYDYDALYCFDVTDPADPKLNKDFGEDGVIRFSEPSNTVAGNGFTLNEGQYMDVDDDGTVWLVVNAKEGTDGIMKIAPDGSACAEVIELKGIYCVEHEGGFLLCGLKDGSAVVILDDSSYETIATIPLTAEYGDRVTRVLVVNDVLFVADAGNDTSTFNAVHAAPLSAAGQEFYNQLVANLSRASGEETSEETGETPADTAPDTNGDTAEVTESLTVGGADTEAPTDTPATDTPETDAPKEGCGATVAFAAVAVLTAAAAFAVRKKD
ncbi:MAG: hypothetical protein J6K29_06195 [Clostridia bacterium]|nr:hypothetical protein [Clostridia bacterium]